MTRARIRRALPGVRSGWAAVVLTLGAFVLGLSALSAVGYAQTGRLKGKVVDAENKPVEGAAIVMESKEMNRKLSTKTDKRGEYTQFLAPGEYNVTATQGQSHADLRRQGQHRRERTELHAEARAAAAAARPTRTARKRKPRWPRSRRRSSRASRSATRAKFDEAIAKFNEVLVKVPKCVECYTNIGAVYSRKKDYDQAEAAYKKAIEVNPSSAEAYMGLANVYNAQKKFDQATEAGAQAQKLLAAEPGWSRGRRQRIGGLQPGRHRVERGQDSRGAEALRAGGRRRPEDGRSALLARAWPT